LPGDDILIGGYTTYDSSPAALDAIMREWTRSDLDALGSLASYNARIEHLMNGNGLNGAYVLESASGQRTVYDDSLADVLTGGDGIDWFLGNPMQDTLTNVPPERVS
jgi:Ca2+-binding RTX toxin-like protein